MLKTSESKFGLKFEVSSLKYPHFHVHHASYGQFDGIWGCGGLKTASIVSGIKLKVNDLNYPGIHMHVNSDSHIDCFWGHDGLQMTSEDASDLKIKLSGLRT